MWDFREKKEMHEKKYQASLHMTPDVREAKRPPPAPPRFGIMEDGLRKRKNIGRIYHELIRKEWEKYNLPKRISKTSKFLMK